MNNHHLGSGHAIPYHEQSRRQQQYHSQQQYQYGPPMQSPMHANPYAYHHGPPPPFYPQQQQYQRWQYPYNPYSMPPVPAQPSQPSQHVPAYPPRSPLVVSSQPQQQPVSASSVTPRQAPTHPQASAQAFQHTQLAANSPRAVPQHLSSYTHNTNGLPSPAPTPPKREETPVDQSQQQLPPREDTRSVSISDSASAPSRRQSTVTNPLLLQPETRTPYYPSLPWYSPDASPSAFPRRSNTRRKRQNLTKSNDTVALPYLSNASNEVQQSDASPQLNTSVKVDELPSETSTVAATSARETPATSQAPSEADFAQVSTPTTPAQAAASSPKTSNASAQQHARKDTRTAVAVPIIGGLPKAKGTPSSADQAAQQPSLPSAEAVPVQAKTSAAVDGASETPSAETPKSPPKPAAPKSWADLVRTKEAKIASAAQANGTGTPNATQSLPASASLAEALKQHAVTNQSLSFLEPRGLANPGNMCYMNSILQVLVFCSPFYDFLDQVRQRTVHSMKSETPLLDVMIMFMREFKVLSKGESAEKVKKSLRQEQLEQYGEPITPDYVYDAIRNLPRFQGMRRGHQQDAEEFLGFLLEGLHDECVGVIQNQASDKAQTDSPNGDAEDVNGWLEVGPKQKSAVTRTAGQEDVPSPVTKIFGGHLRSELRVPGQKDSVTLEPYKPLQLDIGSPQVNNIVDALKGLTHTETLTGDFGGRGNVTAKKQVFIDTLPPVLILHLKRFQYENALGGTQKIWKKVGYPLELEIPKDVLPPSKRGGLAVKGGLPKYRLISVVYHHGKSAAGGHYTVDVLRQDSSEWVRMDDTIIRRVRPQDVAEGGAEEDPKLLAKALEQHKNDSDLQKQRNIYEGLDDDDREHEEKPWSEVNGSAAGSAKKLAAAAQQSNGTATPTSTAGKRTPTARREAVKDNKVAYILLYERIRS